MSWIDKMFWKDYSFDCTVKGMRVPSKTWRRNRKVKGKPCLSSSTSYSSSKWRRPPAPSSHPTLIYPYPSGRPYQTNIVSWCALYWWDFPAYKLYHVRASLSYVEFFSTSIKKTKLRFVNNYIYNDLNLITCSNIICFDGVLHVCFCQKSTVNISQKLFPSLS